MDKVPFRQVHLDFHTSPCIGGIGEGFNKDEFIAALNLGHVNSITLFAKGHHGYSFYPSSVNETHPGLKFNLLGEQLAACKEAGVRAPVYISVGFDEKEAQIHPEWLLVGEPGRGPDFVDHAGYKLFCVNTPYLDKVVAQTQEVIRLFDPCEVFFDICDERVCYCQHCLRDMRNNGLDPHDPSDVKQWGKTVYKNYCDRMEKTVHAFNPDTVVFHNAGNIPRGRRDFAAHNGHLELESLPTGGWGYDHFPMSAAYCRGLGYEYIGMTGKFHTTWGEFGGFKHPNALIYETCLSLALGAKCSIGDQLHPSGKLNEATYRLIGKAYAEVEKKEAWCSDVKAVSDIGVLGPAATKKLRDSRPDVGANRILLEKKYLYDFIDEDCDFSGYKLIILPDDVAVSPGLQNRLDEYLASGGKIIASGDTGFTFPGLTLRGAHFYKPDYFEPADENGFTNGRTQYVMYSGSHDFEADSSFETVGYGCDPYFNRSPEHFSSHQHTPDKPGQKRPGAVMTDNFAYICWNVFTDYAYLGELHCKELVALVIEKLIGNNKTVSVSGLPDRGITTLMYQKKAGRYVNHLLFVHTTKRGEHTEVIEDVVPVSGISVSVRLDKAPVSVRLQPEGKDLAFSYENGVLSYTVPVLYIHAMVEITV